MREKETPEQLSLAGFDTIPESNIESEEVQKLKEVWAKASVVANELAKDSPTLQRILQRLSQRINLATLDEAAGEELFFSISDQQKYIDEEIYCHSEFGTITWHAIDTFDYQKTNYISFTICFDEDSGKPSRDGNFIEIIQKTIAQRVNKLSEIRGEFESDIIDSSLKTFNNRSFVIDFEDNRYEFYPQPDSRIDLTSEKLGIEEGLARFEQNPITTIAKN